MDGEGLSHGDCERCRGKRGSDAPLLPLRRGGAKNCGGSGAQYNAGEDCKGVEGAPRCDEEEGHDVRGHGFGGHR